MPCHPSPHGSPPLETHPGRRGDPSEACRLLSAATEIQSENFRTPIKPQVYDINNQECVESINS